MSSGKIGGQADVAPVHQLTPGCPPLRQIPKDGVFWKEWESGDVDIGIWSTEVVLEFQLDRYWWRYGG